MKEVRKLEKDRVDVVAACGPQIPGHPERSILPPPYKKHKDNKCKSLIKKVEEGNQEKS